MKRCQGLTASGNQCKRVCDGQFCHTHRKDKKQNLDWAFEPKFFEAPDTTVTCEDLKKEGFKRYEKIGKGLPNRLRNLYYAISDSLISCPFVRDPDSVLEIGFGYDPRVLREMSEEKKLQIALSVLPSPACLQTQIKFLTSNSLFVRTLQYYVRHASMYTREENIVRTDESLEKMHRAIRAEQLYQVNPELDRDDIEDDFETHLAEHGGNYDPNGFVLEYMLKHAPNCNRPVLVFRGQREDVPWNDGFDVRVSNRGVSTAHDPSIAKRFGDVLYVYHVARGAPYVIMLNEGEAEVMLPPGVKMTLKHTIHDEKGNVKIRHIQVER